MEEEREKGGRDVQQTYLQVTVVHASVTINIDDY